MTVIYKYGLKAADVQEIQMPQGAHILCVQTQHGEPQLWAEVERDAPVESRYVETFATGEAIPTDMGVERKYIGTFQLSGGSLVFHVYERIN